ncbi:preprotein translocase subunit SecE [Candidatus Berkelbacteria bacterium CG_4_9_14_0_2_um_filter_42_30]|uniref:Protein translocase subunit SecE n=5 Tax=Candidatus Berkelbacteria TaxID=1618330 RepID=A0A2M7K286_9BACT|nr:MAG: preprotein translocase subunit SecE [Candidatus Berkelbacteria bacterium CG1_02_42_45]PIR27417.1 MAG: preprotein translocase subunit SecE [Candidatus Berkelbacteria bacterium CG11_big_fil_rev_8_21_14_0_20_42_15]PIX30368.1 MAG: preprotein translocase subunit SecE [Candidatus Berkelbacteria bacterium CG_4_8_14_3_um_filter_42_13]PIZ27365.1 MAG: preprotein translocase subunit SecE [Candidatus Berkelbacteria bacterium CG_4_10_14_0_8_um_filter_42_34]PJC65919.1 MAG: preprotein translocase subu
MRNNKVVKYFIDSYQELRKVTWATRKQLIRDTAIVIISAVVVTAFVGVIDLGLSKLIEYLISIKG